MDINGTVAIVTGGASGLGAASVRMLVAQGAKVVIFDLNEEKGAAMVAELGDAVRFEKVNVASEEDVARGIATAQSLGELRICVNSAGIGIARKVVGRKGPHDLASFRKTIEVNLIGTFNVTRLAAAAMCALEPANDQGERGVIVNTASIAAWDGQQGQAAYSASKGGVVGMTLPLARDLARKGVRVNTVAPGLFLTPLLGSLPPEAIEQIKTDIEFPKRLGDPSEIARTVRFLVENPYMNGEAVRVDGATRLSAR